MNILVTGASGFVGSQIVKSHLGQGDLVIGLYNNNKPEIENPNFKPAKVDISTNLNEISAILNSGEKVDKFYLSAAASHPSAPRELCQAVNVDGTENVLSTLYSSQSKRAKIVYISTTAVYPSSKEMLKESFAVIPDDSMTEYAKSKLAAEKIVNYYHGRGIEIATIRCANSFGEGQSPQNLIPKIIKQTIDLVRGNSEHKIKLDGGGIAKRDWIPVEKMVEAIRIVLDKGTPGEIYNGSTGGKGVKTIKETVDQIVEITLRVLSDQKIDVSEFCKEGLIEIAPEIKGQQLGAALFDNEKITKLGFKVKNIQELFNKGVRETVEFILKKV